MNNESFYTPKDKLTTRYAKAMGKLEKLPALFYLANNDNSDSQGTPNLDLSFFSSNLFKYFEYSKLLDGSYHTEKSNSDPNIARSISFFVNNLPSFKKYKDTDDLSFIIDYNRLLTIELFEYYAKNQIQV